MRSLLLAWLSMACACACDESQRAADPRAPVAPKASAVVTAPSTTPSTTPSATATAVADDHAPVVAAVDPREATRHAAHDVLAEHCGECHESHRPTAKPKALAVFDLDKPDWPSRFDEHKFNSALKRLAGKSDAARDAFIAFRDAELKAADKPN
jgi:mono/diheme cytochrome c family protein